MKKSKNIIITNGKYSYWQLGIAALLYTIFIITAVSLFYNDPYNLYILPLDTRVFILSTSFAYALKFSLINNVYIDLENKKIKKEYMLGNLKFGHWKKLPEIEYLSLFKQSIENNTDFVLDLNLWVKNKKHIRLFRVPLKHYEEILQTGIETANTLDIPFFNATADISSDWYWMDVTEKKQEKNLL